MFLNHWIGPRGCHVIEAVGFRPLDCLCFPLSLQKQVPPGYSDPSSSGGRTDGPTDLLGRFKTLSWWLLKWFYYNLSRELSIFVTFYKSITDGPMDGPMDGCTLYGQRYEDKSKNITSTQWKIREREPVAYRPQRWQYPVEHSESRMEQK